MTEINEWLVPSPLPPRDPVVDWWISHGLHIPRFRLMVRDDCPVSKWREANPQLIAAFRKALMAGFVGGVRVEGLRNE